MLTLNSRISKQVSPITLSGLIITLGIVFGDIGTSPLYVMKAIVAGSGGNITEDFIVGAISCIIWTLTLQTTIKYVLIILRADNKGEGGILALYALVRKKRKWLFVVALIGGSALLADGVIAPSITVVSAVEGLHLTLPQLPVIPVALAIITLLFLIQQFGTATIGKSFGPMMFIWFLMLGTLGVNQIIQNPVVLKAFNPWYAINLLVHFPNGFLLLGAVFLCTTGAEALYNDLGHCGLRNIRTTWIYVKTALILNYLGQGAWILNQHTAAGDLPNPFFAIMPAWFLPLGVVISTVAAIIASQASISGSYTVISEAIQLNLWPKLRISYPTNKKGQMYITSINWMLFTVCIGVVLLFQNSSNIEAAYGLAITITMLMTTLLMVFYLSRINRKTWMIAGFALTYLLIEGTFLLANLSKFQHGGWFTLLLAGFIAFIMFVWYRARGLKNRFTRFVRIEDHYEALKALSKDNTISKFSTHLVYLTRADMKTDVEAKVIYSIFNKTPKRADMYWLLHVHICDDPHTLEYSVEKLIPGVLMRIEFRIGFKKQPRINLFFMQVIKDLVEKKELNLDSNYPSLRKFHIPADFRFILIKRIQNYDFDFPVFDQFVMDIYALLAKIGLSDLRAYGLDTSNVMIEMVPLMMDDPERPMLKRIQYPPEAT
jgi:KUP system potassium uptake protein